MPILVPTAKIATPIRFQNIQKNVIRIFQLITSLIDAQFKGCSLKEKLKIVHYLTVMASLYFPQAKVVSQLGFLSLTFVKPCTAKITNKLSVLLVILTSHMHAERYSHYNNIHTINKQVITHSRMHKWGIGVISDPHAACSRLGLPD